MLKVMFAAARASVVDIRFDCTAEINWRGHASFLSSKKRTGITVFGRHCRWNRYVLGGVDIRSTWSSVEGREED